MPEFQGFQDDVDTAYMLCALMENCWLDGRSTKRTISAVLCLQNMGTTPNSLNGQVPPRTPEKWTG
jgi:hypothetical protein